MKRLLFDTNVVLDVLLNREPWVAESYPLWQAHDQGRLVGFVSASSLTDIFYVARRMVGVDAALKAVRLCLATFEICTVDRQTLEEAAHLSGNDFEDNLQMACATIAGLEAIVTRDKEGFKDALVSVLTPADVLKQLGKDITD